MPALRILGGRISWLADDDLRCIAQWALGLRIFQLLVAVPALIVLLIVQENTNTAIQEEEEEACQRKMSHASVVVWSFWSLSITTILSSIVLEIFLFRIASRGSPTETQQRRKLPFLCTIKVLPLTVLRIVTVLLAMYTLTVLEQLCHPGSSLEEEAPCQPPPDADDICPPSTEAWIAILAYTHIIELSVVALILLGLCVFHVRHQQRQLRQFWGRRRGWDGTNRRTIWAQGGGPRPSSSSSFWHGLCRCCCVCTSCCTCCLLGGSEVLSTTTRPHQQESSLTDISMILADFFDTGAVGSLDITISDLLVGFTVLSNEQRKQKEARFQELQAELEQSLLLNRPVPHEHVDVAASVTSAVLEMDVEDGSKAIVTIQSFAVGSFTDSEIPDEDDPQENEREDASSPGIVYNLQMCRTDSEVFFKVATRRRLNMGLDLDRQVLQEGAHYMRYALAVYGHLMYLAQHTCTAPCVLTAAFLCHRSRCPRQSIGGAIVGDNLCGCNELGFLLMAGLPHSQVAYASFKTGIKTCPYIIAVDQEQRSLVLTIQGTFSLESMVTDLNIRPELLELYKEDCPVFAEEFMQNEYCHSGMLRCALTLYQDLERHQVLDSLLLGPSPKLSGYSLVITGHSLGAGIAAVLAIMLRNKFPLLRCLCFAPPGCVLSLGAARDDHIFSFVLDSDLVSRLSLHSVVGLRNDVLEMIARVKVPKHTVLGRGLRKKNVDIVHRQESIPQSSYYDRVLEFNRHQNQLKNESNVPDVKLCLAGRIVHLVENKLDYSWSRGASYIPLWAERDDFEEIQLTKTLFIDHDPERYLRVLTNAVKTLMKK